MKKFRLLFLAMVVIAILAVSASAASIKIVAEEVEVADKTDMYEVSVISNMPEIMNAFQFDVVYNTEKVTFINTRNYGAVTENILNGNNGKNRSYCIALGSYTYLEHFVDPDFGDEWDEEVTMQYTYTVNPKLLSNGVSIALYNGNVPGKYHGLNEDFTIAKMTFNIPGGLEALEEGDFELNKVYLGTNNGDYVYKFNESFAGEITLDYVNDVVPEGGSDEPAGPTVDETLTTTEKEFIDVCPVYKTNFATPADEYGFIGALDTIEDAAFVCGAEGVISGVVESTEAGEYTVIVKGVPSGESVKVRPYYCVEGNYFYGAVVTYTAA